MESSIRTLLFTDIEGSTALLARTGKGYAPLVERHRRIVRSAVAQYGGIEHGTEGDSFFVSFDDASSAIGAGAFAQRALAAEPWPDGIAIRVRMGLHVGEVQHRHEGPVGLAINHTARIAAAAHGGQLILSEDVRRLTSVLPDDVRLVALGQHRLRDIGIVLLHQVTHDDLRAAFPPLRAMQVRRDNLPRRTSPMIGRVEAVEGLLDQVRRSTLLTLTGTGGVGKTRLAVEIGHRLLDELADGVWLVELACVSDPGAVVTSVAAALSLGPQPDMSVVESIIDGVRSRQMLLIIDNCEHVIADVSKLVEAVLDGCPRVTVLVTSREALALAGERVHRVVSLDSDAAVDLFVERAHAADNSFAPNADDRIVMAEICMRLDGIPLAIELAAARSRSMSLIELLARLSDRFRLLRGGARGGLDRHQTLQAAVSWSYQLLAVPERVLFDRLSVFSGGFDLNAAEEVCADDHLDRLDVGDFVHSLVDKSMVVADRTGAATRYRLLETLRQFGETCLDGRSELGAIRDRHLDWCLGMVDEAVALLSGRRQVDGHDVLDREWDNIRIAQQWALATGRVADGARVVTGCLHHAECRMLSEHSEWLDRFASSEELPNEWATLVFGQAAYWHTTILGDEIEGFALAHRGISVAPTPHHPHTVYCWAAISGANTVTTAGSDQSEAAFDGFRAAFANITEPDAEWWIMGYIVDACLWGHQELFGEWFERMRSIAARVRAPELDVYVAMFGGHTALVRSPPDPTDAAASYRRMLELARAMPIENLVGVALRGLAMASCAGGQGDALGRSMEAFDHLYHLRYWQKANQAIESVLHSLATSGHLDDAAVVLGYVDHALPTGGGLETDLGLRDAARALIGVTPRAAELAGIGAAMTRDEVAQFVLTESAGRDSR